MFEKGDLNYSRIHGAPNKGLTKIDNPKLGNSGRKPGGIPWNKGKTGLKVTAGCFKRGHSPWNKDKNFPHVSGDKNVNWKGGITPINKAIRESSQYAIWRKSVFERDGYTCVECKKIGGFLQADHIKPFCLYPSLRFDINNGRTLCKPCHKEIGWSLFKENNPKKKNSVAAV